LTLALQNAPNLDGSMGIHSTKCDLFDFSFLDIYSFYFLFFMFIFMLFFLIFLIYFSVRRYQGLRLHAYFIGVLRFPSPHPQAASERRSWSELEGGWTGATSPAHDLVRVYIPK
jgi:hypothetical protein